MNIGLAVELLIKGITWPTFDLGSGVGVEKGLISEGLESSVVSSVLRNQWVKVG